MTRNDIIRMAEECAGWKKACEDLLNSVSKIQTLKQPPTMLAEKESYELGKMHGAATEREACAKMCESQYDALSCAAAIRARGAA